MLLATWFGIGLLPIAPGSWASLAALPVAWGIRSLFGLTGLAAAVAVALFFGWWAADVVAKASPVDDPGAIVIEDIAEQRHRFLGRTNRFEHQRIGLVAVHEGLNSIPGQERPTGHALFQAN